MPQTLARILLLSALLSIGLPLRAVFAADEDEVGGSEAATVPEPSTTGQPSMPAYDRALPFMAEEAIKRGYKLPLPYGAALVLTGLGNREIDVTDVRVGLEGAPQSVSDFVQLGSTSDVFNANIKFDAWLLPFMNVYALVGYVHNHSTTHALVTVQQPGPLPGTLQFEKIISTELDGIVGGLGTTLAAGYRNFYFVLDASFIRSDLGFDNTFHALIASVRAGYQGKLGALPLQLWVGVGNWDTAATATGHADLEGVGRLVFEADQQPHTNWMYDIGGNLEFSRKFQVVADVGADFQGGYYVVLGPTYRF
jgi:hypothetical protein